MTTRPGQKSSWQRWAARAFCLLIFTIIMVDVARRPLKHTTMPTYRTASTQWWSGQDPYTNNAHAGFLYFPQAAFLFTPFNAVPFFTGEFLWRATTFGLFFYALVRLAKSFLAHLPFEKTFLVLTLLAVPSALASLRNAQFDLPLAALILLATAEVASARWNAATAWLCLAIALKPLAVVPLLLFAALYRQLIPRVIVGFLIVIALPFLHWNPAFVTHEYVRCFETLVWASKGNEARYSDLAALLSHFGYDAPDGLKTMVRVFFALVFLGLGAMAIRLLHRIEAAWTVGALSADYLMLFNPRTETCSYVFLGPFVAALALFYAPQPGRKWLSYGLGFCALGLACDAFPKISDTLDVHMLTDRWFKPFIALLFFGVLIQFIVESRLEKGPGNK